jgi:hypothetical protein
MTFQCERCWFLNLEGQLPELGMDDIYIKLLRQAILEAMGDCAITTTKSHAAAIKCMVWNSPRSPYPLSDTVGMSIAVDMLFNAMMATPKLWGETHIQFKMMRQVHTTFTKTWISSPQGIA